MLGMMMVVRVMPESVCVMVMVICVAGFDLPLCELHAQGQETSGFTEYGASLDAIELFPLSLVFVLCGGSGAMAAVGANGAGTRSMVW